MKRTDLEARIRKRSSRIFETYVSWRRKIQIGFVVFGVVVAGSGEALSNMVPEDYKQYCYAAWVVGLAAAFVGGVVVAFIDDGEPEALSIANEAVSELRAQDAEIDELEAEFTWITHLYAVSQFYRELIEAAFLQGNVSPQVQKSRRAAMLDQLLAEKETLLGVRDERWNFAIYLYNSENGLLECDTCRRPTRAEEEAPHRSWSPGEGHIGLAFQSKRRIIAANTSEPEASALFDAPESKRLESDRALYKSIASIPILLNNEQPVGVLVATTDVERRFSASRDGSGSRDSVEPMRQLASALALLERLHKVSSTGATA
ncbi:MAG: GAF domain-containing protein [Alphaproteobacteria bacterium]|nr:GAF domain-containing protein [Alphaproteobacteria bacterium]